MMFDKTAEEMQDEIDELQAKLINVEADREGLEDDLLELQGKYDDLESESDDQNTLIQNAASLVSDLYQLLP